MSGIEATSVVRHWLELLVADSGIASWSMSKYGKSPTFYLGINVKDPPSEENMPVIALYPLPESGGREIYPWTHAVGVEWAVSNENTRLINGINECLGLIEADELGQKILDVILADDDYISNQVDYTVNPVEHWPMYQGEMSIVARPASSGGAFLMGISQAQLYPVTAEAAHAISYGDPVTIHQADDFQWSFKAVEKSAKADVGVIHAHPQVDVLDWTLTIGVLDAELLPYFLGGSSLAAGADLPSFKLTVSGTIPGGDTATIVIDKAHVTGIEQGMNRGGYATLLVTGQGVGRWHDRRLLTITGI